MPIQNPRHSRFFWRSSAMFCILDEEHLFKEVNAAWERTLGLTTSQLLAKRFTDFVHTEDKPLTDYYFDQLKRGLGSVSFSNRFNHHEGFYRQILWEINSAASKEYAFYVVGMDVTDREQPMIADEMISVLQEGVVLQYANGTIGACNPSAERILGLSSDQMMGWTLVDPDWRIIHEDGSPLPTETHPAICTLRTGQSYADVIMGVVRTDETTIWLRVNSYPLWRDDVTQPYAVVISFSDITLFKQAEQYLRQEAQEQSEQTTVTVEHNYDLWDWNLETNEVYFSSRWKEMLGFTESELKNHIDSWQQRIHPADYKRVLSDIQNHLEGLTQVFENTHRVQHKDGSYRWILSHAVLVRGQSGEPNRLIGTHIDVTEPRRIEEELTESEKRYKQLLETTPDAIFIVDIETLQIVDTNRASLQLYAYSRHELLQLKQTELSAQPDKTERVIKRGSKFTSRQHHRKQDGTVFPVEVNANPFIYKGKQAMMMYVRDISEQQRVETALWESESKYRQLFEASSTPTVVFDANSQHFFDVNRAAIDLYGYTKEEWLQLTTEDVSAESVKRRSAFGSSGKKVQVVPLRWHKKKDGTIFPVEVATGSSYLFQGRSLVCATLRDITERKAHEEALRKEKDFVDTLVQASPAFFFAMNPDGTTRMINKAMLTALDYILDEVVGKNFLATFISEEERAGVSAEFDNLIKTMRPSLMENHIITKSGDYVLVEWHSRAVVKADGSLDFLFGVGVDVTERKEAQGHLQLFRSVFEASREAIAVSDPKGNFLYTNTAHERLFSYIFKESSTLNFRDFYPPESLDIWEGQIATALTQGKTWEGELDVIDSEGNVFSIWKRADTIRDTEGNILFKFCFMHDISEQQQTWESLRRQWEEYQTIFNAIPAMIWYRDRNNYLLRTNAQAAKTFKQNETQLATYIDCEEVIQLNKPQLKIIRTFTDAAGSEHWLKIDKMPCWNKQGDLVSVIVFAVDITEDKQMQTPLSIPQENGTSYMDIVVANMPAMLVALDAEGHFVYWNRACEEITGYRGEDMVGNNKALTQLFSNQVDRRHMLELPEIPTTVATHTKGVQWETNVICRDGKARTIAWHSVCKHHYVPSWHVWHIGQDVTQRKQMERLSRETRSLLPQILELARLGICLTDDRGRILQVNRAFAEFYGFKPEELVGQRFTVVLPAAIHDEEVREYYSLLLKQNEPTLIKQRHDQHRNGQAFEVQVTASRVVLEDKRRVLISFISKLSDLKQVK